jgi:hypothetical protein
MLSSFVAAGAFAWSPGLRWSPTQTPSRSVAQFLPAPAMAMLEDQLDEKPKLTVPPLPPAAAKWEVHKFGGASLATADLYIQCSELLRSESARSAESEGGFTPTMAIVSAKGGVTDKLINVVAAARDDIEESKRLLEVLIEEQLDVVRQIASAEQAAVVEKTINSDAEDILMVIRSVRPPRVLTWFPALGPVVVQTESGHHCRALICPCSRSAGLSDPDDPSDHDGACDRVRRGVVSDDDAFLFALTRCSNRLGRCTQGGLSTTRATSEN